MCNGFSIDYETGSEYGTPARFYKNIGFYSLPTGQEFIQKDIYLYGPITSAIKVYSDFYTFDFKEVYVWDGKSPRVGGHSIEILGWGTKNNIPYWIVKNSWGLKWGLSGYFMIKRGSNECAIEENCIGCFPDYFYNIDFKFPLSGFPSMPESIIKVRHDIATNLKTTGGGLDQTVGYTRRVLNTMQWLDFTPPINKIDICNINTFVAGLIGNTTLKGLNRSKITYIYRLIIPISIGFIIYILFRLYINASKKKLNSLKT
jgi:hypothetical protein